MNSGWLVLRLLAVGVLFGERSYASDGRPDRAAYFRYCSSCHGADGRGNGVVAGDLRTPPTDLTQLAKKNGGTFPYTQVRESIDGRKRIAAHGSSEMPVWGQVFAGEKTYEQPEAHAKSQVHIITDYLSTIQGN